MKKIIIPLFFVTVVCSLYAGQKNTYVGYEFTAPPFFLDATDPLYYRDGVTPVDRGCLLQNIIELDSSNIYPPYPTNTYMEGGGLWKWRWYVDYPANVKGEYNDGRLPDGDTDPGNDPPHPHQDAGAGSVGSVNGLGHINALVSAGNFKMGINGVNNEYGWLRAFSGTHWTNSAYYCDGDQLLLPNSADWAYAGNTVVSNINPAYIIQFIIPPPTQTVNSTVAGQAYVGTGNNELESNVVLVEWIDENSTGAWTLLDETLDSNGSFSGIVSANPDYPRDIVVRARVKDSFTLRVGFPVSEEYHVQVMPEPGIVGTSFIISLFCLWYRRKNTLL